MTGGTGHWRRRPVLGSLVRALVVLGPLAFAVLVGLLVAVVVPRPAATALRMGWSIAVMSASTLALLSAGRLARRLLPLSLLLRVGVAFPDTAPRRFGIALRAVRPGKGGDEQDPASALSLLAALLAHDRRTRGHSERVAAYALLIADELGLDEAARNEVRWAGLLHDVGKIDVPPGILNKAGSLDEGEWAVMSSHPEAGAARVAPLRPWLGDAVRAADGHHERWDGRGYPNGVAGVDLPLSTRIVAVADAFETMTAARPYKTPMSLHEARAEVAACSGGQFDPAVARALLGVSVPRLCRVAGPLAWLAQVPLLAAVLQGSLVPGAALVQGAALTVGQMAGAAALVGTVFVAPGPRPIEQVVDRSVLTSGPMQEEAALVPGSDEGRTAGALPPVGSDRADPTVTEVAASTPDGDTISGRGSDDGATAQVRAREDRTGDPGVPADTPPTPPGPAMAALRLAAPPAGQGGVPLRLDGVSPGQGNGDGEGIGASAA